MRHTTFRCFHCVFSHNHTLTTSILSRPIRVVNNLLLAYHESYSAADTKIEERLAQQQKCYQETFTMPDNCPLPAREVSCCLKEVIHRKKILLMYFTYCRHQGVWLAWQLLRRELTEHSEILLYQSHGGKLHWSRQVVEFVFPVTGQKTLVF